MGVGPADRETRAARPTADVRRREGGARRALKNGRVVRASRARRRGLDQSLPFAATIVAILLTDLLVGVLLGILVGVYFPEGSHVLRPGRLGRATPSPPTWSRRMTLRSKVRPSTWRCRTRTGRLNWKGEKTAVPPCTLRSGPHAAGTNMEPKYLNNTLVRLKGANATASGTILKIIGSRQTETGTRYDLTDNPNRTEGDFELVFEVDDDVERWSPLGQPGQPRQLRQVGKITKLEGKNAYVAWEQSPLGTLAPAEPVARDALRTCQCEVKVGAHVPMAAGQGKVTAVRGLRVTVEVLVDGRTV